MHDLSTKPHEQHGGKEAFAGLPSCRPSVASWTSCRFRPKSGYLNTSAFLLNCRQTAILIEQPEKSVVRRLYILTTSSDAHIVFLLLMLFRAITSIS